MKKVPSKKLREIRYSYKISKKPHPDSTFNQNRTERPSMRIAPTFSSNQAFQKKNINNIPIKVTKVGFQKNNNQIIRTVGSNKKSQNLRHTVNVRRNSKRSKKSNTKIEKRIFVNERSISRKNEFRNEGSSIQSKNSHSQNICNLFLKQINLSFF